jgi:type III pantothenate kinase
MSRDLLPLLAIDIGNSRTKAGWFEEHSYEPPLPLPLRELHWKTSEPAGAHLKSWLDEAPRAIVVSSVNRPAFERLKGELCSSPTRQPTWDFRLLHRSDLPIVVDVDAPDRVGMDRLVGAVAANKLRLPENAAIVLDVGTAITANLIRSDGAFAGGAILPGIEMSVKALADFTDQLPFLPLERLDEAPPPLGKNTEDAIRSGIHWGAVGAMKECVQRIAAAQDAHVQIFLTGGAATSVASELGDHVAYVPHLKLSGIAVTAEHLATIG